MPTKTSSSKSGPSGKRQPAVRKSSKVTKKRAARAVVADEEDEEGDDVVAEPEHHEPAPAKLKSAARKSAASKNAPSVSVESKSEAVPATGAAEVLDVDETSGIGARHVGPELGAPERPDPVLDSGQVPPATRAELLSEFGEEYLSIQALFHFCFVPTGRLAFLREISVVEEWGDNSFVLLKYLAVHVRLAIEQSCYVWNGDQLVMTAGRLTTANGAPIYLGLVRNQDVGQNPWVLNWVGERPSCAELPEPPRLPRWPLLRTDADVVVAAELIDPERRASLPPIDGMPIVAQSCAIAGAVAWSIHRGLAVPQLHGGSRGFFVPLYLRQREDVSLAPDAAVPIVCVGARTVVRAVLDPHVCYPSARALVERFEQLPPWLVDAWEASHEERDGDGH